MLLVRLPRALCAAGIGRTWRRGGAAGTGVRPALEAVLLRPRQLAGLAGADAGAPAAVEGFDALGLDATVAQHLRAQFPAGPLPYQVQAMPAVATSLSKALKDFSRNSGRDMGRSTSYGDVVLCAETGSGKTISYVAPILSTLADEAAPSHVRASASAIILCPNMVLAHQAHAAICNVFGQPSGDDHGGQATFAGRPLAEIIDGSVAPRVDLAPSAAFTAAAPADGDGGDADHDEALASGPAVQHDKRLNPIFFVATPAGLVRHLRTYLDRGRQKHFVANLCSVVLDEADMLLSAYEAEMRDVFTLLVYGTAHEQGASFYAKKDLAKFLARNRGRMHTPQIVCAGATLPTGALKAPGAVLRKALTRARWVDSEHKHQTVGRTAFHWLCLDDVDGGGGGGGDGDGDYDDYDSDGGDATGTMAASGTGPGGELDPRLHPLLRAILTQHRVGIPRGLRPEDDGVGASASDRADGSSAVDADEAPPLSCIVFTRSLVRAQRLTEVLRQQLQQLPPPPHHQRLHCDDDFDDNFVGDGESGGNDADDGAAATTGDAADGGPTFEVAGFHRDVPLADRLRTLEKWRNTDSVHGHRVLVCTDAAARGLDLPHVDAVIHADFASSAIDFLHRSGRTGRARRGGTVISLYTHKEAPLVDKVREAVESGGHQTLEETFSRRRSFRKKHKRHLREQEEVRQPQQRQQRHLQQQRRGGRGRGRSGGWTGGGGRGRGGVYRDGGGGGGGGGGRRDDGRGRRWD